MVQPVSAHTVARFTRGSDSFPLSIEIDPGLLTGDEIPLLLFPPDVATIVNADVGTVRRTRQIKSIQVPAGRIQFNGSAASLPRIPETVPQFTVHLAIDALTGLETGVSVSYDGVTNQVKVSKNILGIVSYAAYTSRAERLMYKPKTDALPGGGNAVTYGVIWAFAPPSNFALFEFPLDILPGQFEFELYRITSRVVTNQDGAFEKPANYPTDGVYDGKTFVLDTAGSQESKRVHEIGMMTASGQPFVRLYFHTNLTPYFGDNTFTPTRSLEPSTLPSDQDIDSRVILQAKNIIAARGFGKL